MRGDSGVAGEGRVVGVPKFHSWGKCTMPLTNISSDWKSNASSGLYIILVILVILVSYIIYAGSLRLRDTEMGVVRNPNGTTRSGCVC